MPEAADKPTYEELAELIAKMGEELDRIGSGGLELTTVTDIVSGVDNEITKVSGTNKYAILANGVFARNKNYNIGQNVLVYQRTSQVVETVNYTQYIGELFVIDDVKEKWVELRVKGERRLVAKGKFTNLKGGDIVLLDKHHTVVQEIIEHAKLEAKIEKPVLWSHIGGNEEAKQHLIEAIELPHVHPKLFTYYKQGNANGFLLVGPPGTGKTLLGKAVATSVGSTGGFISIGGPEVLNEYVGATEAAIRSAFMRARAYKEAHGKPAVIFIDEAEALLTTRGTAHNFMGQTVVPTFLTEMDGIRDKSAIVILSTNRGDMIDPAIRREGRIDFKIEVKRPTQSEAREIMAIHLHDRPVGRHHSIEKLIEHSVTRLYEHALPHSGALIEGAVSKAVTHAIRRDIAAGASRGSGLSPADFDWAVKVIVEQESKHAA